MGRITGGTLLIPLDSLRIVTLESPSLYSSLISSSLLSVTPSNTKSVGATAYPLPTEVIPIELILANLSIVTIWGNATLGLNGLSEGKLYPISVIFTFPIFPISLLEISRTAFLPYPEVIVVTPGRE